VVLGAGKALAEIDLLRRVCLITSKSGLS